MKEVVRQKVLLKRILDSIQGAQKILLSLHINPDADSIGSNLALKEVLEMWKKSVVLISSEDIPHNLDFLPGVSSIHYTDIKKMDLAVFDLFLALDASELQMIHSRIDDFPSSLFTIVIDHHKTNTKYGNINLVEPAVGSTGELLFYIFQNWGIKITRSIATNLLAAICGDTGTFRFSATSATLEIAKELMDKKASLSNINFNLYQRVSPSSLKLWGIILDNFKIEQYAGGSFVWSSLPYSIFEKFQGEIETQGASNMFMQSVEGTDFGILLVEERKGVVKGSLRTRSGIDVSGIAALFGGGGHKGAAGFRLEIKTSFEATLAKILGMIKDYLEGRKNSEKRQY